MYKYTLFFFLILGLTSHIHSDNLTWTVIGGGPAGIITVSTLLDNNVKPNNINWIDPHFSVGRLGMYYNNVSANTTVGDFLSFLTGSSTFIRCGQEAIDQIAQYQHDTYETLHVVTWPLQQITDTLRKEVNTYTTHARTISTHNTGWNVTCRNGESIYADHVVLATGARPRLLDYNVNEVVPLDIAIDKEKLAQSVSHDDTVCVVGSAHSAVLLLKYLTEISVKRIINLYKRPFIYTYHDGTNSIHPASGLKGIAAYWAHHVLEKNPPHNLIRAYNDEEAQNTYLPECDKIIYAIGFERNPLPDFHGTTFSMYDDKTGVIVPGLFGIGIAFPEKATDSVGNREYLVGVNSFQSYAQRIIPYWMTRPQAPEQSKEYDFTLVIESW